MSIVRKVFSLVFTALNILFLFFILYLLFKHQPLWTFYPITLLVSVALIVLMTYVDFKLIKIICGKVYNTKRNWLFYSLFLKAFIYSLVVNFGLTYISFGGYSIGLGFYSFSQMFLLLGLALGIPQLIFIRFIYKNNPIVKASRVELYILFLVVISMGIVGHVTMDSVMKDDSVCILEGGCISEEEKKINEIRATIFQKD